MVIVSSDCSVDLRVCSLCIKLESKQESLVYWDGAEPWNNSDVVR